MPQGRAVCSDLDISTLGASFGSAAAQAAPLLSVHVVPHPTRPVEDAYYVGPTAHGLLCGVFDGHAGGEVSRYLAEALPYLVGASRGCPVAALCQGFAIADCELQGSATTGSTATAAIISATDITVANCGDSRALLCRRNGVAPLTADHRPSRQDERDRILRHGGQILWNEGERVMGVLATTRAFGDRDLKQFGVTAEPEITVTPRSASDEFLILATDGVFNVLSNEEVADVARRIMRRAAEKGAPRAAAIRMAASAIGKFSRDRNSKDDITVVLLDLASVLATGLPEQTQTCTPATVWHTASTPAAHFTTAAMTMDAVVEHLTVPRPWIPPMQTEREWTAASAPSLPSGRQHCHQSQQQQEVVCHMSAGVTLAEQPACFPCNILLPSSASALWLHEGATSSRPSRFRQPPSASLHQPIQATEGPPASAPAQLHTLTHAHSSSCEQQELVSPFVTKPPSNQAAHVLHRQQRLLLQTRPSSCIGLRGTLEPQGPQLSTARSMTGIQAIGRTFIQGNMHGSMHGVFTSTPAATRPMLDEWAPLAGTQDTRSLSETTATGSGRPASASSLHAAMAMHARHACAGGAGVGGSVRAPPPGGFLLGLCRTWSGICAGAGGTGCAC